MRTAKTLIRLDAQVICWFFLAAAQLYIKKKYYLIVTFDKEKYSPINYADSIKSECTGVLQNVFETAIQHMNIQ